ncbi:MAG: hypothetical protein IJ583_03475, partial [Firmicutes bacterium]|nr:hypothetical protein [Bacillota bacterium]
SYLESEVAYYDPNIVNVTPNKPDIYPKINPSDTSNIIDVYWDTFARYPYNSNEEPFVEADGTYIDRNVNYDLYISDSLESIDDPTLPKSMDFVAGTTLNPTVIEDTNTPVYYRPFSTYYTNENGDYVEKSLKRNKTYYIKVVATKLINGGKDLVSDPAYATIYLPPKGEIAEPQTLSKPPLRIKKKSDGKPEITQSTITVEWSKKWYEVYSEHFDDWYSSVAIRDNNIIVGDQITEDDKVINIFDCQSEEAVRELFKENGLSEERADNALLRYIDISGSDVKYEMQVLDFDLINAGGGYKSYVESIMESDTGNWQTISPTENTNGYFEHTVTGLDKNKTYIIILRPYRVTEDGKKDAYPTYVMGTTLPSDTVVNIMPTVPILREVSHSDSTIEVNWEEHIPNLDYEMVVSEIMLNDPATGGKIIGNDEIVKNGQRKEENLKYIRYYTIRNLFPQTGYYVWVRSIAHNSDGDAYSQWSNPVYVVTDKLQAITPPRGLGLVSQMSLDIYNKSNSLNYIKADYNYLIVEWFKNANDETEGAEAPRQNNQSDAAYDVLSDPEIKNTYIVKFNNLINNTYYYVRAKTTLAVTRGKDGESVHTYAYIVQLSADEDFKDVVEVSVPITLAGETSTAEKVYIVESEWCDTIRLITSPYDNEYDGNQNPDFYPLPDDDFELIYIYPTLTYRFRSDKEDMEGYDDNLVDQRFITRLVKNRTFNYKLDLTSYDGNLVTERAVEIPYSVISAFDERKISLEVRADNAVFTFKPGFLDTQEVRNIIGYGYGSTVKINILQKPSDIPALSYNQNYESTPQKVSVAIQTKDSTTPIKTLAEDMTVALKLNNRYSIEDNNVGSYEDTDISMGWERIDYTYDANSGYFTSEVKTLGTFAGIAISAPLTDGGGAPDMAVNSVISKMNITDMTKYDPDAKVSSLWFNNLVAAVAMGKKDTTINTPVATDEYNALRKKGMLIDGAVVSREAAVNALIKLYETKTKRPVSYYSDINSTPYSDIKNASKANQTAMLKAAELGFFDGSSSRPKDVMTMKELFEMLDIVMTDGNM